MRKDCVDTDELLNQCVHTVNDLNDALEQKCKEIEAIMNIIDIRIKENRELAIIHYPQPEDKYINEYESRAEELEQLKKLIRKPVVKNI